MLFCNLTPLDGRFVKAIVFWRKSEFVNTLPLYTFNIQFMYDNLNFSFLLWSKLHLYFVTFLLLASIDVLLGSEFDRKPNASHGAPCSALEISRRLKQEGITYRAFE